MDADSLGLRGLADPRPQFVSSGLGRLSRRLYLCQPVQHIKMPSNLTNHHFVHRAQTPEVKTHFGPSILLYCISREDDTAQKSLEIALLETSLELALQS